MYIQYAESYTGSDVFISRLNLRLRCEVRGFFACVGDPETLDLFTRVWVRNRSGLSPLHPETDNFKKLEKFFANDDESLMDIRVIK